MMKRTMMFLVILCILCLCGCRDKKEPVDKNMKNDVACEEQEELQSDETETTDTEALDTDIAPNPNDTEKKQEQKEQKKEEPNVEEPPKEIEKKPDVQEVPVAPEKPDVSEEKEEKYDPQKIVVLATQKTKGYGKILLTENLDRLLAEGQITKEEYEQYYPYDGAGYYSVFMECELSKTRTTSGTLLGSEEAIASYIADMLSLERGEYFLIEYSGIYQSMGEEFYEFRCYRA